MLNLAFLKKDNGVDIDFDPELVMISLNSGKSASIRVASGDENNINKNLKVDLSDVNEFTIHLEGFTEYENKLSNAQADRDSVKYLCGTVSLKLNKDNEVDPIFIPLTDHRISVFPHKAKEGKKTVYVFPEAQIAKDEIEAIWKDVFAESLSDFMLGDMEHDSSTRSRKSNSSEGWSLTTKICIGLVIASLLVLAFGFFNKRNNVQANGQETITGVYDEISKMPDPAAAPPEANPERSADQEAMAEFGLEEGIQLD